MRFTKDYTKLKERYFTTIRKNTGYYKVGKVYEITTPSQTFRAMIIEQRLRCKSDITDDLALSDADCSAKELVKTLEKWYGKSYDDFVLLTLRKEGETK